MLGLPCEVKMKKLYRFFEDFGRMGEISGLFIADEKDVKDAIGQTVYLGEVLGKHSDIDLELDKTQFKVIPVPRETIEILLEAFGSHTLCGMNPLEYVEFGEEE